jgi:DivIVA domain-containing protein
MTGQPTAPRFTVVRMREGYDISQVDEFLDQVSAALEFEPPLMRAGDVESHRFRPVRLRSGYEMGEVDDHLDALAAELRRREPADQPVHDDPAPSAVVEPPRTIWPFLLALLVLVVAVVAALLLG